MGKRLLFDNIKETYDENGCVLLSDTYKNIRELLEFKCKCGTIDCKSFKEFKKNPFCFKCSKNRLTIEEVREFVENKDCKLISTIYVNNRNKMKFICSCGESFEKTYDSFRSSPQCKKCGYEINAQKKRYTYEKVYNIFLNAGCFLLENEYKNNNQLLKYICDCGNEESIILGSFLQGHRCKKCGYTKRARANRHSYEFINSVFLNKNCILLTTEYINNKTILHYICSCGNEDWTTFDSFSSNKNTCRKCANQKIADFHSNEMVYPRGENHSNWDHSKTQEEREKNRWLSEQKVWRKQIYKRDRYTCQCCGDNKGGNLVAHHLDGYDWAKESRWDVNNGITLCNTCHNDFHHVYGYGLNTREQFEEYMEGISWSCVGIYKNINLDDFYFPSN